jgi:hypothetical protein
MDFLNSSYINSLLKQIVLVAILLLTVIVLSAGNPSVPVIVFSASLGIILIAYNFVRGLSKEELESSPSELASRREQAQQISVGDRRESGKTFVLLAKILEFADVIDTIGRKLTGDVLWKTIHTSVKDATVIGLLLQIPNLLTQWIIGKNFSSLDSCLAAGNLSVDRYACFIIVLCDFLLWVVLTGRFLGRFLADVKNLTKSSE